MYKKDDIIMYGTSGVCRVVGMIERDFGGTSHPYYQLQPVYDEKSTLFVPLENPALVEKMHGVLSADAVEELLHTTPEQQPAWIADEASRKQHYKEILEGDDRKALICAIQALYRHRQSCREEGKKLHVCDERFLKDAERILYDELAFVLKIDRDKILGYILSKLDNATA